jgi:hypothetical protein
MTQPKEWQELTKLTQGAPLVVERVRMGDVAIEGQFELPQLARLTLEDQVFVAAFLKSHGSIKEMEQVFGVSYPTVKARLNRIASQLEFVDTNPGPLDRQKERSQILERLERGEITPVDAIRELEAAR